jgi:hypothetical protein
MSLGRFRTTKSAVGAMSGADANVLFGLNLPPNPALNHKLNQDITLAYD